MFTNKTREIRTYQRYILVSIKINNILAECGFNIRFFKQPYNSLFIVTIATVVWFETLFRIK